MRDCLEVTPEYGDRLARFVRAMAGAPESVLVGMDKYHSISLRLGRSGIRDFEDIFTGDYRVAGRLIDSSQLCYDLFAILEELDGVFTVQAVERLIGQMWQGQALRMAPPYPPDMLDATMGMFYSALHMKRRLEGSKGFWILAEVPDEAKYARRVDLLFQFKRSGELADTVKSVNPLDTLASVEVKWFEPKRAFAGPEIEGEIASDLRRALDRFQDVNSLFYTFPEDYPAAKVAQARDLVRLVFDRDTRPYLQGLGWTEEAIAEAAADLSARLNGEFFQMIPGSV
jgi:hypothetical protein